MKEKIDVVVIGAGIVGLANAWTAARQGRRVRVIEKDPFAAGASIRNFGMIWPIGQSADRIEVALASRDRWLELAAAGALEAPRSGSIHLAVDELEEQVMREFAGTELGRRLDATWVDRDEVRNLSPAVGSAVIGGLHSDAEVAVDATNAIASLTRWLESEHFVEFVFGNQVVAVEPGVVRCIDGSEHRAERIVACIGAETGGPFGEVFKQPGMRRSKLQMLETMPQPNDWQLGAMIASGLSLRHYAAFRECPSLREYSAATTARAPELDRWGIHVMASQRLDGSIVLGDSHLYDEEIEPFDSGLIDECILRELRRIIDLPDWTIRRRWSGIYAKHEDRLALVEEPMPGCHLMVGPGGAGMTLSFGLADRFWSNFA